MKVQPRESQTNNEVKGEACEHGRIIMGKRKKNRTLKLVITPNDQFVVIANRYFLGTRIRHSVKRFSNRNDACRSYYSLEYKLFQEI
ncbi:MAG: hypothetical protein HWE14_11375 [Flavobacteriia bacterium]|nr:hypothetical protein [Flavobacteriia bacterium]